MFLLIIIMMSCIAVLIFSNPASTDGQVFAVTIGYTSVWVLIAILAMGGRRVISSVGGLVLVVTCTLCYLWLGLPVWQPYVLTLLLTGGLAIFVMYTQDRYDRQRAFSLYEVEESRDKIRQQAADLRLANENLLTFTRAMSHDLQSPLRSVRSFLDLYQKRSKNRLPTDTQEYLDLATHYLKRGQSVVSNLLTYSRIGKDPITKSMVELRPLLEGIITELTEASEMPRIHCFELNIQVTHLRGDTQLLWHVFSNLLNNAIKFSQSQEEPLVVINAVQTEQEVIVEVIDNGVGFDQDFSKELGRPFTRLHGSEFAGTGIGLSIVRQAMGLHNGRFWAESKVNQGASFFCAFPLH
jgi:signal transduction histidine kinase